MGDPATRTIKATAEIAQMAIPYTRELPMFGLADNEPPVIILRGLLGEEEDYVRLRHSLAEQGKEAVTFSSPCGPGKFGNLHPMHLLSPGTVESLAAYGVIRHIKSDSMHKQVDLVGHSLGGQTATSVAIEKPASVRSVTYVGSACLASHTLSQSIGRSKVFLCNDLIDYLDSEYSYKPHKIAADGIMRSLRAARSYIKNIGELKVAATGNLQDKLKIIRRYGVITAALQAENDPYSPPEEAYDIADLFDTIKTIPGDHLMPQKKPDETAQAFIEIQRKLFSSTVLKQAA